MRSTLLALLVVLPLFAEERGTLDECVEKWRSADPADREAASRAADDELRRLLAPLLKALADEDPEVRARARGAILSLVPAEGDPEAELGGLIEDAGFRNRALLLALVRQQREAAAAEQGQRLQQLQREAEVIRQRTQRLLEAQIAGLRRQEERDQRAVERWRQDAFEKKLGITARPTGHAGLFAKGVKLLRVEPKGWAASLGAQPGDVIVLADGKRVGTPEELREALGGETDLRQVKLVAVRGDPPRVVELAR